MIQCITHSLLALSVSMRLDAGQIAVHIFSEGQKSDFGRHRLELDAVSAGVQLHLTTRTVTDDTVADLESHFHHMVMADGLLIAESSLSAAAMLLRTPADAAANTYHFCNRESAHVSLEPGLGWP